MKRACVLAFVMACGGSSTPAAQQPASSTAAAAGPSCDQAAGHMIDLLTAGKQNVPPDQVKQVRDVIVSHCTKDAWTADLRQCLADMHSVNDADACESKMTDAQKQALDAEMGGPQEGGAPPPPAAQPVPASAAPPPAAGAPGGSTRGPAQKPGKSGDPEDGGN